MQMKRNEKEKGITLLALVITVVVLLILAGITIGTITGDNGIIRNAQNAKEDTEIANEKEVVEKATVQTMGNNKYGNVEKDGLQEELDKETGDGKTEVSEADEYFKVVFKDSERSYLVDKNGNVMEVPDRSGIQVGDYVNYTYDTKAEGYNLLAAESGYDSDQTVTQAAGMKWRILNIHPDGRVDLISETVPSGNIYFQGALGYNNGVYLLNDICKELYSNRTLGVEARSIDLEDVESQMNEEGIARRDAYVQSSSGTQYGNTKTYTGSNANYPNLYAQENGSGFNLTGETEEERKEQTKRNGIGVNDDGYTSPTEETSSKADSLTVTQSYYYFSNTPASYFKDYNGSSSTVREMIFNTGTYYWLASRYAGCYSSRADFGLLYVGSSALRGSTLFGSNGTTYSGSNRVRPVVSLGSNIEIEACEGENSSTNMHQISKK